MATYLEIVNKVMRRMREPVVGSVSENTYSLMVGEFVNDAKRVVEDAWSWRALVDTVTVPTISGTASYDLEDFNCSGSGQAPRENARILIDSESSVPLIRITTDNEETLLMKVSQSYEFIQRIAHGNDNVLGRPEVAIFGVNTANTAGNTNMRVFPYPIPDAAYNIQIYLINPQNDLTTDGQVLLVPTMPVVQLAYLYCLYERGEEIGEVLTLTSEKADLALSDAIAHDSSITSDLIFRPE